MDATDVGQFNHRNVALEQGDREAPGVVFGSREQHSRFYDFHHENRGMALIFNHTKFDLSQNLLDRDGSDKDCADLVRVLEVMKFEVTPCINFTKAQVEKKLEDGENL